MGKYNFTAQKWAEFEQRLKALEQANDALRAENATLRQNIPQVAEPLRLLSADISNYDKATELFGIDVENDELVADTAATRKNFATFYQNIFRALNPRVYAKEGHSSRIVYVGINDVTPEQYQVYVECLEACIDTIYYAKKKLKKDGDDTNANGTDITVG